MLLGDMREQVCKDLRSGKLVAFGMREGSAPEDSPVRIPAHLFPIDDQSAVTVDWDNSALLSADGGFVRVRVTTPSAKVHTKPRHRVRKAEQATSEKPFGAKSDAAPRKRGRPRIDERLRTVVRSLEEQGLLAEKMRKEQVAIIRKAARDRYPYLFPKPSQPSQQKIYDALTAEGLVSHLAPSGLGILEDLKILRNSINSFNCNNSSALPKLDFIVLERYLK